MSPAAAQVGSTAAGATAQRRALADLHAFALDAARRNASRDGDARARVSNAIARLAAVGSPEGIIGRAAAEIGIAWEFQRVLFSVVNGATATPRSLWVKRARDEGDVSELQPIELAYPLIEAEMLATGGSRLVDVVATRRRVPETLVEALALERYVVAVVAMEGDPVALLHADAGAEADDVDERVLAAYALGLGRTLELSVLERTLQAHRAELWSAIKWMSARLERSDDDAPVTGGETPAHELTAREAEVLALMGRGLTNRAIAEHLVISEGTAKYHVKNVLRKLGASNRADAVARHRRAEERRSS